MSMLALSKDAYKKAWKNGVCKENIPFTIEEYFWIRCGLRLICKELIDEIPSILEEIRQEEHA